MKDTFRMLRNRLPRLLLALLLPLWVATASAQPVGHMLDSVDLLPAEKMSYLTFKGYFESELFEQILIEVGETPEQVRIIIPNAFINSVLMEEREYTDFPENSLLSSLTLNEEIRQQTDGSIDFLVRLDLLLPRPAQVLLDTGRSSGQQLTLVLQDATRTVAAQQEAEESQTGIVVAEKVGTISGQTRSLVNPAVSAREAVLLHPVSAMLAYRPPLRLNLAVFNASPRVGTARRLAIMLEHQQRRSIEERLGLKLEILNISSVREDLRLPRTKIYFRPNFLKAALTFAEMIPGEQVVEPMPLSRLSRLGNDVEIYVGENFE